MSSLFLRLVGEAEMTLWLRIETGGMFTNASQRIDLDRNPAPTIGTEGISSGGGINGHWLEDDGMPSAPVQSDKPPYRVPPMAEIATLPQSGLRIVSTFSGCGGSCLGYRMAGYRVLWANEFLPAAQECYRLNHPDSILDCRDIRIVQAKDILAAIGLCEGELDLLDGSPPCQAFSTAGKRQKGWGKAKRYDNGIAQCNESLFAEYARLLRGLRPKVFLAENVSGLVKGVAKGYFLEILKELKECGYCVEARVLDAQWLGVPQMRQRLIFQGVREDVGRAPAWPRPLPYRYSVREAIGVGLRTKSYASNGWTEGGEPAAAVQASGQYWTEDNPATIQVSRDRRGAFGKEGEISDSPVPAILAGTAGNLWIEEQRGFDGHRFVSSDSPQVYHCRTEARLRLPR
jgi:DNA-cytosine methyltransferase